MELLQSQGVKVRLLDLKRGDIRPGLAKLRNRGIQNFLVDIGAEYLKLFFEEVCILYSLSHLVVSKSLENTVFFIAYKAYPVKGGGVKYRVSHIIFFIF